MLPRSVAGICALILAFALGASASGAILFSYYAYSQNRTDERVARFEAGFTGKVKDATDKIQAARDKSLDEIASQLEPLRKTLAESATLQSLLHQASPALYFVHTLDENGAPSVGTAFAVASDTHQTLLIGSFSTVKAATRRPGPDVFVKRGDDPEAKVTVYTWQEGRDLALLILRTGGQPVLEFSDKTPQLGERVFAVSGLGGQGAAITQGFVADVSAAGIQHDAPIGTAFQGGPLLDSDGKVIGINSLTYAPLGFTTNSVWFAIPGRAACEKVLSCPGGTPVATGSKPSA